MIDLFGAIIGLLMIAFVILIAASYFTNRYSTLQKIIGWSMISMMVLGAIFLK